MSKSYDYTSQESSSVADSDEMDSRPKKRARLVSEYAPSPRRFMLEEVDLEIAIQERIASMLESRLNWALCLQQTLENSRSNVPWTIPGFRDSAISALEAAEDPCTLVYTRDPRQTLAPTPLALNTTVPTPSATLQEEVPPQTSTYATRQRGSKRGSIAPPRKLLYLRNHATQPPQIVKLACPDCAKTNFSSLQGLLNHCRLSHSREFGSHDECVQCCAVLVESMEDGAWIVANGTEVAGISIPGLRRLFELAVGGGQGIVPILNPKQPEVKPENPSRAESALQDPTTLALESSASHVTRTLGHHIDTPALAPFLGRETKRRTIRSYDEDADVDVLEHESTAKRINWRMHYTHRSKARASLDEVVESTTTQSAVNEISSNTRNSAAQEPLLVPRGTGSRFHIMARLSIRDLSLWIPPDRRSQIHVNCTHKWRLIVSSPSYSLPLNTFLTKLTMTCLTDPAPSTLLNPIIATRPHFVITGITDRPFLARLTFEWSGSDGHNPPVSVEHWVDLDPMHYSTPVLGDEQFLDVELDRHTVFLPEIPESEPPGWDAEAPSAEISSYAKDTEEREEEPEYVVRLRSLLPEFPMTLRDLRGRSASQVPYTLVSTPAQFRNLVYGRRKSIEWGRARALRSAYDQQCTNSSQDHPPAIPLTTGDVFRWLEDEGLILRNKTREPFAGDLPHTTTRKRRPEAPSQEETSEAFCRFCGLHFHLHPTSNTGDDISASLVASDPTKQEPIPDVIPCKPPRQLTCRGFLSSQMDSELPVMDVHRMMVRDASTRPLPLHGSLFTRDNHQKSKDDVRSLPGNELCELLSVSNPALVRAIAASLVLPGRVPVALENKPRVVTDVEVAPAALLALAVKPLVKVLVKAGVNAYREDEAELRGQGVRARRDVQTRRLLTPMHVARGLLQDAPRSPVASAVLLSMLPLGLSLPSDPT